MVTSDSPETEPVVRIKRVGGIVVLLGGVLTAVAYWALPLADIPLVGSLTAPAVIKHASNSGSLGLLRLVPITAVLTILLGVWLVLRRPTGRSRQVGSALILVCSVLGVLAYLIPLRALNKAITSSGVSFLGIHATTFTGTGFWLALIGVIISAVGVAIELASLRTED
ncbi:MAG: hypothetical protein JO100_13005 [Pseudonocardia sp.]|nr:hypothetical protein [Pseudonocardia sp.]